MNIIMIIKIILKWFIIYLFVGMISFIFVYFSRYDELLMDTLLPRIISECKLNMNHD